MNIEKICRVPVEKLRKESRYSKEEETIKDKVEVSKKALPLQGMIGQDRAVKSMQFGLEMDISGYNIAVVGPPGTGKSTYVDSIVHYLAEKKESPSDWCYIHNFQNPDRPIALSFLPGKGKVFKQEMEDLIEEFKQTIPLAFENNEYKHIKGEIVQRVQGQVDHDMRVLKEDAKEAGYMLQQNPQQLVFVPFKNGEQLLPEEYEQLPTEERKEMEQKIILLEQQLENILVNMQGLEKEAAIEIGRLNEEVSRVATAPILEKLKSKYTNERKIQQFLNEIQRDVVKNYREFQGKPKQEDPAKNSFFNEKSPKPFLKYQVNLFITNEYTKGAPAIIETFTNYYNIFGKIEYKSQLTSTTTDFTMIKPGAVHLANGGYLVLQAKDLLFDSFSWETLKKILKQEQGVIENIGEQYRYVPTATLKPEPIPLNVKVILICSPLFYEALRRDEDFQKLFKVKVDFDREMDRNDENVSNYVSYIKSVGKQSNLLPFASSGIRKIIEYGSRLAGSQYKLSTQFNDISEVIQESHMIAKRMDAKLIKSEHVERALEERRYRSGLMEEKLHDLIQRNKIMIETDGEEIGQVNGLSIIQYDRFMFGFPARITARTFAGTAGITNIERETEMSGSTHSKGVLTLAGYLGGTFAQKRPLGLSAQISFEQHYGGVEGDSASSTELYALLSSLSNVPIKQSLAVTGSINQHGKIQPIGGATEKIEGFFDLCHTKGLTGDQGVLIPVQNVQDLMLKDEVIEAVKKGKFHVYSVENVEQGIELLTGLVAGKRDESGKFPSDTLFSKIEHTLEQYTEYIERGIPSSIAIKKYLENKK